MISRWSILLLFLTLAWMPFEGIAQAEEDSLFIAYQPAYLAISPLGFVNKARVKYERPVSDPITLGTYLSVYYGFFPGVQLAPFGRLYIDQEAPEGMYLQAKVIGTYHDRADGLYLFNGRLYKASFFSMGLGGGVGMQWSLGKAGNTFIDLGVGFKVMTAPPPWSSGTQILITGSENTTYYLTGPGSIFDGLFAIGFRI